jgi:hypothetical protein
VDVLIGGRGGGALVPTQMMLSLNDHDSLQGVNWPFVCKLVHCFSRFAMWGGYSCDLSYMMYIIPLCNVRKSNND